MGDQLEGTEFTGINLPFLYQCAPYLFMKVQSVLSPFPPHDSCSSALSGVGFSVPLTYLRAGHVLTSPRRLETMAHSHLFNIEPGNGPCLLKVISNP